MRAWLTQVRWIRLAAAVVAAVGLSAWSVTAPAQAAPAGPTRAALMAHAVATTRVEIPSTKLPFNAVPSPDVTVPSGYLQSVACASPDDCEAVGSAGGGAVAERWDGSSWTLQTLAAPNVDLTGVTCVTGDDCEAVGDGGVAELWDGSTWTLQTTPGPTGGQFSLELNSVSCVSSADCEAVGYSDDPSVGLLTLAEGWNGSVWTEQTTPTLTGTDDLLDGVSCVGDGDCEAVGSQGSGTYLTLGERWDGTTWTAQTTPSPGGVYGTLNSVACSGSNDCEAIGDYTNNAPSQVTLAEQWNGATWSVQTTPNPSGGGAKDSSTLLTGVACSAADDCEAVGYLTDPFAEKWNGTTWTLQAVPDSAGATSKELNAVSCPAAGSCEAVGSHTVAGEGVTYAAALETATWTAQTPQNFESPQSTRLTSVSCPATDDCEAVGYYKPTSSGRSPFLNIAEKWDGSTWTLQATPQPAGASTTVLNSVSCSTSDDCEAVGYYLKSAGGQAPLAEGWDGTTWTVQPTAVETAGRTKTLAAVSCTPSGVCEAVGDYFESSSGDEVPLVEQWNGSTWVSQTTPTLSGTLNALDGVSCDAHNVCEAVGMQGDGNGTLAEGWNGKTWAVQTTPSDEIILSSVSCNVRKNCEAVGYVFDTTLGRDVTAAERWNGTTWVVQTIPNLKGTTVATLAGVSCTADDACEAVGSYIESGTPPDDRTLAEVWDGTAWMAYATPDPAGTTASNLGGVSCTALDTCEGVGNSATKGLASTLVIARG